jgi:hypothetical protein
VAGNGAKKLNITTEKRRGFLLISILWGYLRKAAARQVVADQVQMNADLGSSPVIH